MFPAKYRGVCIRCDEPFDVDQMIESPRSPEWPATGYYHAPTCPAAAEPKPTRFQGTTLEDMGY
jgi:hypothetical protein